MPELIDLKAAGEAANRNFEDVKDLTAFLQQSSKAAKGTELIESLKADLQAKYTETTQELAKMREGMEQERAAMNQQAAENANIKSLFAKSSEADRMELLKSVSKEFGIDTTALMLSGSSLKTFVHGNYMANTEQAAKAHDLSEVSDFVLTYAGLVGGVTFGKSENQVSVNQEVYAKGIDLAIRAGLPGAQTYKSLYIKGPDALDTQTATHGAEWLPVELSNQLIRNIWLDCQVANLIERKPQPSATYDIPALLTRGRAYLMDEALVQSDLFTQKVTADAFTSDKITLNARKFGASILYSTELTEDSIIDVVQEVQRSIREQMVISIEDGVINGNRTTYGSGLDNAAAGKLWTSTADARYFADGIRYNVAAAGKINSAGTMSLANLRATRKPLGKAGLKPSELAWVFGPSQQAGILNIDEVLRWRDIQDKATVLSGALAEIDGIGIIFSEYIYENLNASGVYDATTMTKTVGLLFRPQGYVMGDRRIYRVEQMYVPTSQQTAVVATARISLKKKRSSLKEEAYLYNLVS